jgi:hypothetical protein
MTDPQGCVPTFQVNLRHDTGSQSYIVSVSIIHPDVAGFRGIVRRLASKQEIIHAFDVAGINQARYTDALAAIDRGSYCCIDVSQNEAQRLQVLQTDSTE